jgi:hypothetical protein
MPRRSTDQVGLRPTFKVIAQSMLMALRHDIEVYSVKIDCRQLGRNTLGNAASRSEFSPMYVRIPMVILDHMEPEAVQQYISLQSV